LVELLLVIPAPDLSLIGNKEESSQRVQSLALIDLHSNAPLEPLVQQIAQDENRFVQAPVFLKGAR
jgi:hypothetical protein